MPCSKERLKQEIRKVTKIRSRNLLGETPKEENRRLVKQGIKAILAKKHISEIREIKRGGKGFLKGTTVSQRKMRREVLQGAGL